MAKSAKRLAPLPRVTSKTITVGALLGKIKRLILAEPKRLDMTRFIGSFQGKTVHADTSMDLPACGTVACMAGWGAMLLRPDGVSGRKIDHNANEAMDWALGFATCNAGGQDEERSTGQLFDSVVTDIDEDDSEWFLPRAGTPEHAAVIAKRIDTYLSQHPEIVNRRIVVSDVQKALRA